MNLLELASSYKDWNSPISTTRLADNGFRYTGISDTVECVNCHTRLSNWKESDNIQRRHYDASRNCKYVQSYVVRGRLNTGFNNASTTRNFSDHDNTYGNGHGNDGMLFQSHEPYHLVLPAGFDFVNDNQGRPSGSRYFSDPCHSDTFQQEKTRPIARIKQYESETARLDSYIDWPDSAPVKPPTLARAGLFYTGVQDKVKCPFCLGAMYNWENGDNPLSEHAKNFKDCPFVMHKIYDNLKVRSLPEIQGEDKDKTGVHSAKNENHVQDGALSEDDSSNCLEDMSEFISACSNNSSDIATNSQFKNLENAVKIVLNLGYDADVIKAALTHIPNFNPRKKLKCQILLDAIEGLETQDKMGDNDHKQEDTDFDGERRHEADPAGATNWLFKDTSQDKPTESIFASSKFERKLLEREETQSKVSSKTNHSNDSGSETSDELSLTLEKKSENPINSSNEDDSDSKDQVLLPCLPSEVEIKHNESPNSATASSVSVIMDPKLKQLSEEHSKLMNSKMCSVCRKRSVSILTLPCRHLIFCEPCAAASKSCPQCERVIIGTVKIFLS